MMKKYSFNKKTGEMRMKRESKLSKVLNKIGSYMVKDIVEIRLHLPLILAVFLFLIPVMAYFDVVLYGERTFWDYIFLCLLEFILIWIGYVIAISKRMIEDNKRW